MKIKITLFVLSIVKHISVFNLFIFAIDCLDPVIKIKNGLIKGIIDRTYDENVPYIKYRGIPYAEPPINNLRFKPPVPKSDWTDVYNATVDRESCIQHIGMKVVGSENCLFINVYTPRFPNETNAEKLAVMVWIHGGGFISGDSKFETYNPELFLSQNVIFISFNYRVGIFGFLSTGDLIAPGNYGLKDQILALKWVNENVKHFGGNKSKVTIFGQSAGAASVSYLTQIPATEGLYSGAILQSGSSLCQWALGHKSKEVATNVAKLLLINTSSSETIVDGMRKTDHETLQQAAVAVGLATEVAISFQDLLFVPVIEIPHKTAIFTNHSHDLLSKGQFCKVPHIIGFNSNEAAFLNEGIGKFWAYLSTFDFFPQNLVPGDINTDNHLTEQHMKDLGNIIKSHYFGFLPVVFSQQNFIHFLSTTYFALGVNEAAKQISKYTDVYYYQFAYEGYLGNQNRTCEGVAHNEDLQYLFHHNDEENIPAGDIITRRRFIRMWTNFAKCRNPTPIDDLLLQNIKWIKRTNDSISFLDFGENLEVQKVSTIAEDIEFWENIYNTYGRLPFDTY